MPLSLPKLGQKLSQKQLEFLTVFSTSCRASIIEMTSNAASGHPGGSLSCIDYLSILYTFIISQTGEPVIISNGHISPAVYAVLAELGYIPKKDVLQGFRRNGYPYEGHVSRLVPGVWYGTGPLGTGVSAATGFALAKLCLPPFRGELEGGSSKQELLRERKDKTKRVFALVGDGESEEGQVYEMMNFAAKYKLNNLIVFMDYNEVQLTSGLKEIMPLQPKKIWQAAGWHVIDVPGHDYAKMWAALAEAYKVKDKPVLLLGRTIMGKGVDFMEATGKKREATWHGKAAGSEQAEIAKKQLAMSTKQFALIQEFKKQIQWKPKKVKQTESLTPMKVKTGKPKLYTPETLTDCRSAYGAALLDLANQNKNVVALTADLAESVKTSLVKEKLPAQHIECGIAEQHMVSCSGGLSLSGIIPFCSTFGAFMTSRAKDQARVNDINHTNVKMVATHCGLSVGEDGPTHQAIDDMGSMLGLFNTMVIEPADPNHCDRIIRYVGSHYGNFYVRMGRHKIPVLTKVDGSVFFDEKYVYEYGKCDLLRSGNDVTIVASGATVIEALRAVEELKKRGISAELIIASSPKKFDDTLIRSIQKTKKLLTVEDHNTFSGFGAEIARYLVLNQIQTEKCVMLGVDHYELSGTAEALYESAGISSEKIVEAYQKF